MAFKFMKIMMLSRTDQLKYLNYMPSLNFLGTRNDARESGNELDGPHMWSVKILAKFLVLWKMQLTSTKRKLVLRVQFNT